MHFKDNYAFLSNFQAAPINYQGLTYPTIENAFQAAKSLDRRREFVNVSPAQAKRLGRTVNLRRDWESVKLNVMAELLREKFPEDEKHPNFWLSQKLLNTGSEMLVEENTWHDNYWGACTCPKCQNKTHKNMLGVLLMNRRAELKNRGA